MVAKTSEHKSVHVSSFCHMSILPPPTIELWSAVTNNRYWVAYATRDGKDGWRLAELFLASTRRDMYSVLALTGREHDGDVAFLGCTWIGNASYTQLTAEDYDTPDYIGRGVLGIIGQDIHDAFCHTIQLYAQAEMNPSTIPIRRMDK